MAQFGVAETMIGRADQSGSHSNGTAQPRRVVWLRPHGYLLVLVVFLMLSGAASGAVAAPGEVVEFPIPNADGQPAGITAGPDGNVWFTEASASMNSAGKIARITPNGQIVELPLPGERNEPSGITTGPEGNLWFTNGGIGRITPSGQVTEFGLPTGNSQKITNGPDGNLWFTVGSQSGGGKIGRITPSGQVTEFLLMDQGSWPRGITLGPDGNLWFTEWGASKIGRITPTGQITEFPISGAGRPQEITAGPDGNLWFTAASKIGRITPTGQITEFALPSAESDLYGITAGPDGNLWFTRTSGPKSPRGGGIGRITPKGQITLFSAQTDPGDIAAGPDGSLWFTAFSSAFSGFANIGRITPGLLGIEVAGTNARVKRGWARLRLACAGGDAAESTCRGVLRLSIRDGRPSLGLALFKKITLAKRHYSLPSGHARAIALRLSRKARAFLARHHRLHVTATATVDGGQGGGREVVLQLAKRRSPRHH